MKVFRFDDININEDMERTVKIAEFIRHRFVDCKVIFCFSPLVHDMSKEAGKNRERIFPKIMNAYSDHKIFYKVDKCGVPQVPDWITKGYRTNL